eukprot:TRINITY_DN3055_c0_g1_i6.p1 TRINITY_DN3055_c0_g1~~TRINITY_DN3055_c0_g1_i6.p1  ORF type:complete len:997 (-),score=147.67 TRINITY_DN3055_c0_g1_i6:792-3782(-)
MSVAPQSAAEISSYAQQIELACAAFQTNGDHAAERFLLAFRSLINPYALCRHIIDESANPQAIFQALSCLREAIVREWPSLSFETKKALQEYLIQTLLHRSQDARFQSYVQAQLAHVIGVIQKRGWPDTKSMSPFLLADSLLATASPDAASTIFLLLASVTREFTANKYSNVGFTLEMHHKVRLEFQMSMLKGAFSVCVNFLIRCGQVPFTNQSTEYRAIHRCFQLLVEILNWEFIKPGTKFRSFGSFSRAESTQLARLTPPEDWRDLIVNDQFLTVMFQYDHMYRGTPMEQTIREGISQLTSLGGDIFTIAADRTLFVRCMTRGLLSPVSTAEKIAGHLESLPVSCQLIVRLLECQPLEVLVSMGEDFSVFMQSFVQIVRFCLASASQSLEDTDLLDAFDILLKGAVFMACDTHKKPHLLPVVSEPLLSLYEIFVRFKFQRASSLILSGIDDTDEIADSSILEEQLIGVASLGRLSPGFSLGILAEITQKCLSSYQLYAARGLSSGINIVEVHEHTSWLLLLLGHLLADTDADGEEPSIPSAIISWMNQAIIQPMIDLISSLEDFFQFLNTHGASNAQTDIVSPLIVERQSWFLRRWCASYFLRSTQCRAWDELFCSDNPRLHKFIVVVLNTIATNVKYWSGESAITLETSRLIVSLSKLSNTRSAIGNFPSFEGLIDLLELPGWPAKHKSLFCLGIFRICTCCASDFDSMNRIQKALGILERRVFGHITNPSFLSISQNALVVEDIIGFLQSLKGLALATDSNNVSLIYSSLSRYFELIVRLMRTYYLNDEVVLVIIKLLASIVDSQIVMLDPEHCNNLYRLLMEILGIYSRENMGRKTNTSKAVLDKEIEFSHAKEIAAILSLIEATIARDYADFHEVKINHEPSEIAVADVILHGIHIVIPLLNQPMLGYPKVSRRFYRLMTCAMEIYPERVVGLSHELFGSMIQCLEFGLQMCVSNLLRHLQLPYPNHLFHYQMNILSPLKHLFRSRLLFE